jgi:hypothetical protein
MILASDSVWLYKEPSRVAFPCVRTVRSPSAIFYCILDVTKNLRFLAVLSSHQKREKRYIVLSFKFRFSTWTLSFVIPYQTFALIFNFLHICCTSLTYISAPHNQPKSISREVQIVRLIPFYSTLLALSSLVSDYLLRVILSQKKNQIFYHNLRRNIAHESSRSCKMTAPFFFNI